MVLRWLLAAVVKPPASLYPPRRLDQVGRPLRLGPLRDAPDGGDARRRHRRRRRSVCGAARARRDGVRHCGSRSTSVATVAYVTPGQRQKKVVSQLYFLKKEKKRRDQSLSHPCAPSRRELSAQVLPRGARDERARPARLGGVRLARPAGRAAARASPSPLVDQNATRVVGG